jgi:hypothetical protein
VASSRLSDTKLVATRVARFFLSHETKTGKNVPNEHKMYQMVIKYPKCHQNVSNSCKIYPHFPIYIRPSKFYPNWIFGLKRKHLATLVASLASWAWFQSTKFLHKKKVARRIFAQVQNAERQNVKHWHCQLNLTSPRWPGWPDWANFRLFGDYFRWAISWKIQYIFFSR